MISLPAAAVASILASPPAALAATTIGPVAAVEEFAVPEALRPAVDFWTSIYATYTTRQSVLHDSRYLQIVYGVLDYSALSGRTDGQISEAIDNGVQKERERLAAVLRRLATYKDAIPAATLSAEERRILEMFAAVDEPDKFNQAAERIRGQRGQRDRFLLGIANVAPYIERMEQIFRARGLPADLTRLVFVESMFNLEAYSKVGASGPWQFMSATGRRYMTINQEIDERLDPILSTEAAARMLHENYTYLGNWGLAVTAYNHGVGGMRRAAAAVGSESIERIVWEHESRTFGFASRNFYAEFLAARDVYNRRQHHFGAALADYPPRSAVPYDEVVLPDHVAIETLTAYCGVSAAEIRALNPQLTRHVIHGRKYLPKMVPLKIPAGTSGRFVRSYAAIPRTLRFRSQRPDEFHLVRRGETLLGIAARTGMSVDQLADLNGLSSRRRIRAGQKLRVLPRGKTAVAALSGIHRPEVKVLGLAQRKGSGESPGAPDGRNDPLEADRPPIPEMPAEEAALLAAAESPAEAEGPSPLESVLGSVGVGAGAVAEPVEVLARRTAERVERATTRPPRIARAGIPAKGAEPAKAAPTTKPVPARRQAIPAVIPAAEREGIRDGRRLPGTIGAAPCSRDL